MSQGRSSRDLILGSLGHPLIHHSGLLLRSSEFYPLANTSCRILVSWKSVAFLTPNRRKIVLSSPTPWGPTLDLRSFRHVITMRSVNEEGGSVEVPLSSTHFPRSYTPLIALLFIFILVGFGSVCC